MKDTMNPALGRALEKKGYESLTPVQEAVLAPELHGADLLVSAQTGSGKTVAFGIAIAPALFAGEETLARADAPLALAIAPTRELALQVERELAWLYGEASVRIATCVGGMNMQTERRTLERGAHIVVGTPGRLRDHVERGSLDLSAIRAVVLDEADEMLDMGFRDDLEFILDASPASRRTLLFSATVPAAIAALARRYQRDAVRVSTAGERRQHGDIDYRALVVAPSDRENAVVNVLRYHDARNALVFCGTRATVNHLVARLSNRGFSAVALSGELSQNERIHALQALRDGRARVCVATDVAARGIDLPDLELVVHLDLPKTPETLLHRSGRTGRAGRKGVSALVVPYNAKRRAERLLSDARIDATWERPPTVEAVLARDDERLLSDPALEPPVAEDETAMVTALIERYGAERVAAAFLRSRRAGLTAPEELIEGSGPVSRPERGNFAERPPRDRAPFEGGVWFSLSIGRKQSADPRWLLPMLCRAGHVTRGEIGVIRIHDTETHFELAAAAADRFVAAIGPSRRVEKSVTATRIEGIPQAPERGQGKPRNAKPARTSRSADGKIDYAKKRPFTGGKRKDRADGPPDHYADRKPADRMRDELPEGATPGVWPYDDVPAMDKPRKGGKPKPFAGAPAGKKFIKSAKPGGKADYKGAGKPKGKGHGKGDSGNFAQRRKKPERD